MRIETIRNEEIGEKTSSAKESHTDQKSLTDKRWTLQRLLDLFQFHRFDKISKSFATTIG